MDEGDDDETSQDAPLSPAEIEVLCLIADGLTDQEIAARLAKARATIHRHANSSLSTRL